MSTFSYKDTLSTTRNKERRRKKFLDTVLGRAKKKIEFFSKNGFKACIYDIPVVIPGMPYYDLNLSMQHCYTQLTKEGFRCEANGRQLYIYW